MRPLASQHNDDLENFADAETPKLPAIDIIWLGSAQTKFSQTSYQQSTHEPECLLLNQIHILN